MEFKGTKGKWEITHTPWDDEFYIRSVEKNEFIANVIKSHYRSENALLISKAPELLQILEKCIKHMNVHSEESCKLHNEAKTLIKEATEL